MNLKALTGSGDKIAIATLPFITAGIILNIIYPSAFSVGGPSMLLKTISTVVLIPGVVIWMWTVILILIKVPRKELITKGPYSLVKHPLYTAVSLLVLPWLGFIFNSWLGLLIGIILYISSRIFAPHEEEVLADNFGPAWSEYLRSVKFPWL